MSDSWLAPLALVLPPVAAVFLQGWLLARLGETKPIGDEGGYIRCGGDPDPFRPRQFLRVPFMAVLSWLANRTARPECMMRRMSRSASILTIVCASLAAWYGIGPWAAAAAGLILAIMPSRLIYANHVWPDPFLALWLSLLCWLLVMPGIGLYPRCLAAGLVGALAFTTRFDAVFCAPFTLLAVDSIDWLGAILVLAPTVAIFLALSFTNRARYGIFLPDNTWAFNLLVAGRESESSSTVRVESIVESVLADWSSPGADTRERRVARAVLVRPHRVLSGALSRLWAMAGPDTFASERLLPPVGHAYPQARKGTVRALKCLLNFEFPLLVSLALVASVVHGAAGAWLWPTLALVAGNALMARTRYRQAWAPGLVLVAVDALGRMESAALLDIQFIAACLVVAASTLLLALVTVRSEV